MEEVSLKTVADQKLLRGLDELVAKSCHSEADLLAYIAEVDHRKLYLEQGCPSMFGYCTEVLHFSEAQASHRIHAARAARAYPVVFERIRKRELHLAGLSLLAPVLTPENHEELLERARHKSKRAIEILLADRAPKPDVPARVRQLPEPRPALGTRLRSEARTPETETRSRIPAPLPRAPSPLGGKRYKIQFAGNQALYDKLHQARALLRHQIPNGDMVEIFDRALTLLVEDAKRRKFAQTSSPRKRSKGAKKPGAPSLHIPAEIKRAYSSGTGVGVRSWRGTVAAAARPISWNSITWIPGPGRGGTRWSGSSFAAGGTIATRRCRTMGLRTWRSSQGETTSPGGCSASNSGSDWPGPLEC